MDKSACIYIFDIIEFAVSLLSDMMFKK